MSLEEWLQQHLTAAPSINELPQGSLSGVDFAADSTKLLAAAEKLTA